MPPWRRITTWGADPAFNMGLDEALLDAAAAPPTLRLYTWSPDTLSLGWFQRYAEIAGLERASRVVRRITGGGAIHHVHELTFSLTCALDHPLYAGPVRDSYARVHAAIAAALAELGIDAAPRGARALASDRGGTGMCFHHSTDLDLVWGDRKGVGSAQRRRGGRVLHHGSIKLGASPLETGVATAREAAPTLDAAGFAPLLVAALERELGLRSETGVPSPAEREAARELGRRYLDPTFVRRR